MRKIFITSFLILLSVAMVSGSAYAISGVCSSCHTMHNSQNGTAVTEDDAEHSYLLLASCLGCHTGSFSASTMPKVDKTTSILAGGTLSASVADTMTKRHDVIDLFAGGDTVMIATPGGTGSTLTVGPTALRCAGTKGCHGRHDAATGDNPDAAIKGFHHASVTPGYRFLWTTTNAIGTPVTGKGISGLPLGYEPGGATAASHNVYSADVTTGISNFCGECHGKFHGTGNTGASSPFTRHPTDRALVADAGWTWASFGWGLQSAPFDNTPLAFGDMTGIETNTDYFTTKSDGSVMCLSCHRAHGSANADILRWAYNISAGGGSKEQCLACHYKQR